MELAAFRRVDVLNLVIIYLACGAPFAVHRSFRVVERFGFSDLAACFAVALAWPVVAVQLFMRSLRPVTTPVENARAEAYRKRLEAAVDLSGRPDLAFEFRDSIMRYLGLQLAVTDTTKAPAENNLLAITGHPASAVAAACFARRARQKLEFHAALAAAEFRETVAAMDSAALDYVAGRISAELGDEAAQPRPDTRSQVSASRLARAA